MAPQRHEIRLVLDIDLDADPIAGSIGPANHAARRFSGWISLAAAIQVIRAELAAQPPACEHPEPGVELTPPAAREHSEPGVER